jgi:hypothetical protein
VEILTLNGGHKKLSKDGENGDLIVDIYDIGILDIFIGIFLYLYL